MCHVISCVVKCLTNIDQRLVFLRYIVMTLQYSEECVAAVTAQLPGARGYTGGKVIFIDTENTLYVAHALVTHTHLK